MLKTCFYHPKPPSTLRRVLPWVGVLVFAVIVFWGLWGACVIQGVCTSIDDFYNIIMASGVFSLLGILIILAPFLMIYYLIKLHFKSDQGLFRQ